MLRFSSLTCQTKLNLNKEDSLRTEQPYQSPCLPQDARIHHGVKNRRIPIHKLQSNSFKKKSRKAFTTAKKKLGTTSDINDSGMLFVNFYNYLSLETYSKKSISNTSSISPSIKLKKAKDR